MRKITAAALLAALGICATAGAQTNKDLYPAGVTVRAGVSIPIDKDLSNVANTFADIGLDYNLDFHLIEGGEPFFSADYFFEGWGNSQSASAVPVMINERFYTAGTTSRSYYFVGLGAAFMNVDSTGTALAGRVGVGQELGKSVVGEISAYLSDRVGGARCSAVTFNLGYRF